MKICTRLVFVFSVALFTLTSACNSMEQAPDSSFNTKQDAAPRLDSVLNFNSMITAVFEDSKGRMWVGSHCDGLCVFDASILDSSTTGRKFSYYTVDLGLPNITSVELYGREVPMGNSIRGIQEDRNGNIWIETGDGICYYDGVVFHYVQPEPVTMTINNFAYRNTNKQYTDWDSIYNYLWFKNANDQGILYYDYDKLYHLVFSNVDDYLEKKIERTERFKLDVYSIFKDNKKNLWIGSAGFGIYKMNKDGIECINQDLEAGTVRAFYQDKNNDVWISNVTQGILFYRNNGNGSLLRNFTRVSNYYTLSQVRSDPSLDKDRVFDGVQSIMQDDQGALWFGTYADGLWRSDNFGITHMTKVDGLPSDCVKTIYKTKSGKMLFGIGEESATLYTFDGEKFNSVNL